MKKILSILFAVLFVIAVAGCSSASPETDTQGRIPPAEQEKQTKSDAMPAVKIKVGDKNFTVTIYDNESARTIVEKMPFTLVMDDFGSQEKVTDLLFALPSARTQTPADIQAGEIYLWSGNNLMLFYTSFSNSYSYVPVGYIENVTGLRDALGSGSVTVTFSVE